MSKIDKINYEDQSSYITRLNIRSIDTDKLIEDHIKSVNESFSVGSFPFFYFFELVNKTIDLKQDSEGIDKDKRLLFTEDVPPETINTRTITYFLKSRVPGRFDRGPAGIGGIKAVRPVLKQVVPNPDIPGEEIETYVMIYDNWITFYVYARDSHVAMKDVLWFEDLMYFSLPLFESHGFKVIPEGVGDREVLESHETLKLIRYPMSFFVRHEKLFNVDTQTTKHINIRPGIKI
jgi:hypothetical protein